MEGKCDTGKGREPLEIRSIERFFMVRGGEGDIVGMVNIEVISQCFESAVLMTQYNPGLNSGSRILNEKRKQLMY